MKEIVAVLANSQNELELYQAVQALTKAAEKENLDLKIEIQKSSLIYNNLKKEDICVSDVAILTGDTPINGIDRFSNSVILRTVTAEIANNPYAVLSEAELIWQSKQSQA